eukprot:Nitzschia sp. Nitz4//scaffold21_size171442//73956//75951//NITZ4_002163-RA/size171442-augustus-gene-0.202-mRNA-1//-1//CDS//3329542417//4822//frame0
MNSIVQTLRSLILPSTPGESADFPLEVKAVPGLTTLLDRALFRANEGQLTATTCSSHALLACWLDIKQQSQLLLEEALSHQEPNSYAKIQCESFARQCLECSMDAIERLSTEKLALSANLSDPYQSIADASSSTHNHSHYLNTSILSGVGNSGITNGVLESRETTGRRAPLQRRRDCWESPRLICPDHVWADDCYSACHRWVRFLVKHPFTLDELQEEEPTRTTRRSSATGGGGSIGADFDGPSDPKKKTRSLQHPPSQRQAEILLQLIHDDLPMRLYQFRQAMMAEAVVTKRLYLVKSEYRAPFRAFMEAHQTLYRAPSLDLVESYLNPKKAKEDTLSAEDLDVLLKDPTLVELLVLERECEKLEVDIAKAIYPFAELARALEQKKARVKPVPGIVKDVDVPALQEAVRRLKFVLCRSGGMETSTGIRPILLDLEGVPRDDQFVATSCVRSPVSPRSSVEPRINTFLGHLNVLSTLIGIGTKNAFWFLRNDSMDLSGTIVKGCTEQLDVELLKCQLLDWFAMVERQHQLQRDQPDMANSIRKSEMAMSLAGSSEQSLQKVKERLERMQSDREQRLEVLKELVEDLCLREMNLHVRISGPDPTDLLVLNPTSTVGFLGIPLQLAGEKLPIG